MKKQHNALTLIPSALFALLGLSLTAAAVHAGHTNPVLSTHLDGSAEVSDDPNVVAGDVTGHGTAYVFGVDGDPTTLCYVMEVSGIQMVPVGDGMAAHIHEGAMDENGPVVAALAGPEDGNAGDCLTEGEPNKFPTEEAGIVQRILNNPADFYINVHNPQYPAGAIRGQLSSSSGHSH
ncbi:MAG: CHRD domain-containing protein [Cyanobacteria bacterium P01_A01_bin.105]